MFNKQAVHYILGAPYFWPCAIIKLGLINNFLVHHELWSIIRTLLVSSVFTQSSILLALWKTKLNTNRKAVLLPAGEIVLKKKVAASLPAKIKRKILI